MSLRAFVLSTAVVAIGVFVTGCGNTSNTGGNPSSASKTDKFSIKGPALPTTVKQGDRQTVTLTLDRGADFKEGVALSADPSKGLKAELSSKMVQASEPAEVTLTIEADKEAALGDHMVKVTATPKSGNATSLEVKVKVDKK